MTTKKLTKAQYEAKMKKHEQAFDKLWMKMVDDTNQFIKDNPDIGMYQFQNSIEKFSDHLSLSGAWIVDRINGKSGVMNANNKLYKNIFF
jgi:hypothetical protein